jgi:hypothetical protein
MVRKWAPRTPTAPQVDRSAEESAFPVERLPEPLRSTSKELATVYQVPVSLAAMSALAVLSGAVGKSHVVTGGSRDLKTRLNLYVIALAERGSGKGIVGKALASPIMKRSSELAEAYRAEASRSQAEGEVLNSEIKRLQSSAADATGAERDGLMADLSYKTERRDRLAAAGKRTVTLWCSDTTSEALGRLLSENDETLFAYSAEAGGAVQTALGKYRSKGQGDFDLYLSAYSGDHYRADRMGRTSVQLNEPCLALLWMVQGCLMEEIVGTPEAVARGLTARPLAFESGARRQKDSDQQLKFSHQQEWDSFIAEVLGIRERTAADRPVEIRCSPEAAVIFSQLNDETVDLENGPYCDLPGEFSRWRENAIKVAGLIAVAERADHVTADHAERAVAIVRWCGQSYMGLLDKGRRERLQADATRLMQIVLESPKQEVPVGELERSHGFSRQKIEAVTRLFPATLELHAKPPNGPGRPSTVLRQPLNPVNQGN